MYSDIVYLISEETTGTDERNDPVITKTEKLVYVDEKGVTQTEFYQSKAQDLKPSFRFEMRRIDYEGEERLKYNDKEYDIIRTFAKNKDFIELICQGVVNKKS